MLEKLKEFIRGGNTKEKRVTTKENVEVSQDMARELREIKIRLGEIKTILQNQNSALEKHDFKVIQEINKEIKDINISSKLNQEAIEIVVKGLEEFDNKKPIVERLLKNFDISESTAYRWINRIEKER